MFRSRFQVLTAELSLIYNIRQLRLANRTISHFLQLTTVIRHVSYVLQCFERRVQNSEKSTTIAFSLRSEHRQTSLTCLSGVTMDCVTHCSAAQCHMSAACCTLSVPLFSAAACSGWVTRGCHTGYWWSSLGQSLDTYMTDQIRSQESRIELLPGMSLPLKWSRDAAMFWMQEPQ